MASSMLPKYCAWAAAGYDLLSREETTSKLEDVQQIAVKECEGFPCPKNLVSSDEKVEVT